MGVKWVDHICLTAERPVETALQLSAQRHNEGAQREGRLDGLGS